LFTTLITSVNDKSKTTDCHRHASIFLKTNALLTDSSTSPMTRSGPEADFCRVNARPRLLAYEAKSRRMSRI
jgi:hypothetical protein